MANNFIKIITQKADMVIKMDKYADVAPTIQKRNFILEKIKNEDIAFYNKINKKVTMNFTFGNKYFSSLNSLMDANDEFLLCIPNQVEDLQAKLKKLFQISDSEEAHEFLNTHIKRFKEMERYIKNASDFDISD